MKPFLLDINSHSIHRMFHVESAILCETFPYIYINKNT